MGDVYKRQILDNPHYVGDTVLGRTLNAIYKGVKNQHIDREEWIVSPNTHEAIISREDFQKAVSYTQLDVYKRQVRILRHFRKIIPNGTDKRFCRIINVLAGLHGNQFVLPDLSLIHI